MCALRVIPVERGPGRSGSNPGISSIGVLPCAEAPTEHLNIRLVSTEPGAVTVVHHHGELDTTAYVLEGTMGFHCGPGLREVVAARAVSSCSSSRTRCTPSTTPSPWGRIPRLSSQVYPVPLVSVLMAVPRPEGLFSQPIRERHHTASLTGVERLAPRLKILSSNPLDGPGW